MFVVVPIAVLAVEVFVFIEVGHAIGWVAAILLLLGTSLLGARLLLIQGRAAIGRVSRAISERRAPGRAAIDGALGSLGCVLLVVPGFLTDVLGGLLLFPPSRDLARRWVSHHYAGRTLSFLASTRPFAAGARGRTGAADQPPADVESTAVEDDRDQLER
jgi:UPF0716 protein FxsA